MLTQYRATNIAWVVFDKIPNRDKLSWPTMISSYVTCLLPHKAIETFKLMKAQNIMSDEITIPIILSAYCCLCNLVMVINLPKVATQTGLHSYAIVANLLINKEMLGSLNPTFVIPVCVLSAYNSIGSFDMWKRSPSSLAHPVTHFNLGSQFKFWSHGCSPNTLRTRCF